MKIRIHKNTIRIRLGNEDIKNLNQDGIIVECLKFSSESAFEYKLALSEKNGILLEGSSMIIYINKTDFNNQNDVSIEWITEEGLTVLVESDYYG